MLPLLIAEVIRDAWAPSLTVIAVKQDRLVVAAPHLAPAPASRSSGFAWPTRTLFRVLVARGGTEKQRFRRLPYAFVPGLGAPASMGGTWTVPLVAAASDRRTIDSALKNGELVMLAPGIPRPGRIRVRAIDRESGAPVPNVEVFASRQGFSIAPESLIDVTPATGEPVEFLDRQGELWYVSLKSSARVYELPLLCSDSGAVVDVPVTGVDESLLADELAFLSDDFNGAMRRFQRALRQGDRLATEGRHADAYAAYREARAMCPDADEMRRLAEETYRRYHPGREQHAADRERVETFHERVRQQLEPRRRELDMRLNRLREAQELNERVTQAEGLEKQARDSLSRYEAEEALRLYAAAIALLPEGVKYRRDLVQERLRLADTWRVRGGDRQRRARRYVYEELAALTPQNVASGMPVLGEHIRCLIDYRDRYALFKAVDAVRRLFDRVVAEAATPEALSDATRMEELSSVANSLNTLLDRIHDVLREDS